MNVREFMTPDPITLSPDASLADAWQVMQDAVVRHLPIVERRELVGILSDRDLLDVGDGDLETAKVRAVMHPAVTVSTKDSAVSAAVELVLGRIGCLPVVDDEVLVGILSEYDVLRLYERVCREGGRVGETDPALEQLATTEIVSAAPDTTLGEVRTRMEELGVRHMPVLEGDRVVGMLSDRDLRRARGSAAPDDLPVRDHMSTAVLTLPPGEKLSVAAALMAERKIGALVVCRDGDRAVGLVTLTDVLDHTLESLREPDQPPRR